MRLCLLPLLLFAFNAKAQIKESEIKTFEFSSLKPKLKLEQLASGKISPTDIETFIDLFSKNPIPGLETAKGFYLDNKLIDSIRKYDGTNNKPKIESIYLYLSKKNLDPSDSKRDGKYTLIAIPAKIVKHQPSNRDTNFLMIPQSLEWHDLISDYPPINETDLSH